MVLAVPRVVPPAAAQTLTGTAVAPPSHRSGSFLVHQQGNITPARQVKMLSVVACGMRWHDVPSCGMDLTAPVELAQTHAQAHTCRTGMHIRMAVVSLRIGAATPLIIIQAHHERGRSLP